MGLVIVQPDLGTSLLIAISGIAVLWFAGINHRYFIYTMLGFVISLPFIIASKPQASSGACSFAYFIKDSFQVIIKN